MKPLDIGEVTKYVEENIGDFHSRRVDKLGELKLKTVLKRKNPYLFKAKNILTAQDLIKAIVDAYISSSEEGIFGNWLEGLAIHVNSLVYGGRKSGIPGIDLEFTKNSERFIVSIKSGPDWGNDSQIKKMVDHFNSARRVLKTSGAKINVTAVNGCCYGKTTSRNHYKKRGDYYKYCGQVFWEFISGNSELYKEIVEPLGYLAHEKNDDFEISYAKKINIFTKELTEEFFTDTGDIDWNKLLEFNSQGTTKNK
ncbi:PmeII family type II restriction endonuclease [Maribacter sp. 4G9]|uniref:PmeII family type II restriction endonuclease n=1 Tax=Maribacter sp. 4G9 TaxID=1889777 RepID=UPI000C147683|nr:PmeII family type II restriction endonuclease [Maribacter sp. 4G9]PIB39387.1 cytosolic protein [Maribacter sp. 4G9]